MAGSTSTALRRGGGDDRGPSQHGYVQHLPGQCGHARRDDIFVAAPDDVDADATCFAGPARLTEANQIWDGHDDPALGLVLLGTPIACDPFADLGAALPGQTAPTLSGSGPLTPGSKATWVVAAAGASQPVLLALAKSSAFTATLGGLLVPNPSPGLLTVPLVTDPSGNARFVVPALPAFVRGSTVYAQAFVADAGAPAGIAFSNGVLAVVP